jgi:outer membrane protein W
MKRIAVWLAVSGLMSGLLFSQSIHLKIGLFIPELQSDLWSVNRENLTFERSDMVNVVYGGEYEFYFNRLFSLSLEVGSYAKTVFAQYRDYEFEDGTPISQNISLRIVPVEANLKYHPLGHRNRLNPYVGIGAGVYAWTYQQFGNFINFEDDSISEGFAETRRFAFGLNGRAGVAYRFQQRLGILLEGKYHYLQGKLSRNFEGFEPLDMSGFLINAGIMFYFD